MIHNSIEFQEYVESLYPHKENLFSEIKNNSSITNLKTRDIGIAKNARYCNFTNCTSTVHLAETIDNCRIVSCSTEITLVTRYAYDSIITDCFVFLKKNAFNHKFSCDISGIAPSLYRSNVERCFVAGKLIGPIDRGAAFCGISSTSSDSTIQRCVIGKITPQNNNTFIKNRITNPESENTTLSNNISIETNPGKNNRNGPDGQSIPSQQLNRDLLENTLGWDFDTTWNWDTENNRPILRTMKNNVTLSPTKKSGLLLTYQIQTNIWL